ncbi:O-antigen ligase family protein [Flavobacterium limnophilum]|uniref:O-antigen ligase family protein n=1 Tax=Flavobacterium limnophilum TaxID=3003262 RepID=UPI0024821171|nr:O-antigen ligase family protein [Flavobacterium limnophilum]
MHFLKRNIFKIILLTLLLALSLIFNHNADFWIGKEYEYYRLFFLLIFSTILFFTSKEQLQLGKVDVVVISLLLFLAISRSLHLGSLNEIHVINTLSLVIYYIVLKTIRLKKEEITTYHQFLIGIGMFLCGYCMLELYDVLERTNLYWRMKGNFPNPGPLGGFIAAILSLVFYELSQKTILEKWVKLVVYVIVAALMVLVLIKSESRAAMLSAVISITVLASYYGFKKWKHFKYSLLSLLPIFIFIGLSKGTDSISGRLLIWKISLLSFLDRPFTGVGHNFFGVEYLNFQADYFSKGGTKEEILLAGANIQAFNEFLKFIIENGILGIILILASLFWIFKSKNTIPNSGKQNFPLASLAFYSTIIVFASFSFPLQFLPFQLLLLNQIALQEYPPLRYSFSVNKNFEKLLFGVASCFLLYLSNYQHKGFRAWKDGSELQFSNPDSTKILYDYSYQRLQNEGGFFMHYGFFMEDKNTHTALALFKKAKQLINTPTLYIKTARLNEQLGNYKSTEEDLLKLHFISPHLFKPQEELVDFYTRRNNTSKAKLYAKKIMETPIKIPSQEVVRIKLKAKNILKQF